MTTLPNGDAARLVPAPAQQDDAPGPPRTRTALLSAYRDDHRVYERQAGVRAADGFLALRLDGRSFHTLTREMDKPFDSSFERSIERAAEALMTELPGSLLCYCQSDELTLVLAPEADAFDRRAEKLVSVAAGICSVAFSAELGRPGIFDARLLEAGGQEDVLAILAERQQDAIKNAVSALVYWTLRGHGLSARRATSRLQGLSLGERMSLLIELGADFNDLPPERRRGRMAVRGVITRKGFDPIRQQAVEVQRRVLTWDRDMPDFRHLPSLPGWVEPVAVP